MSSTTRTGQSTGAPYFFLMNRSALRWCARIMAADSPAVECPPVWVTSAAGVKRFRQPARVRR